MAGISSKALNFGKNNPEKFNSIEFSNDLDLNIGEAYFRCNDPQTGRWWQVDPKSDLLQYHSPYISMGNNPISNMDPLGDVFRLTNPNDIDYLRLLLPQSHRSALVATNGIVDWDFTQLGNTSFDMTDLGVLLLTAMIIDDNDFEFTTDDEIKLDYRWENDGIHEEWGEDKQGRVMKFWANHKEGDIKRKDYTYNFKKENDGVENLSITPRDDNPMANVYPAPSNLNVEGQIAISPDNIVKYRSLNGRPKPIESILFHELAENYFRTALGKRYEKAHALSITLEKSLPENDWRRDKDSEGVVQ